MWGFKPWFEKRYWIACKVHDMDYESGDISRKEADENFLFNMKSIRPGIVCYLAYYAVRIFGGSRYTDKS